ncbi:LuxR family transcriptional regulator [Streptomyces sp. VRA16 Mangrove soil]|uniref:helix-turn-helix transcriptional regulator n=1 Tax=Streptomyces sp. VRA16 Mangrove soil TaxID=2817434 RepID=UPI001A9F95AC|nr:LuxR family transcriptional regulator [Streptomyces sp. VRA16 Mangrove soil]MBO1331222.1 AAA family ATPase [Streptomyces sp. VRA16 Mangrove soil]
MRTAHAHRQPIAPEEAARSHFSGSALIGRERELRTLDVFLSRTARAAELLVVTGDLGTGRSALLRETAHAARREGFVVLEARGRRAESGLRGAGLTLVLSQLEATATQPHVPAGLNEYVDRLTHTPNAEDFAGFTHWAALTALTTVCANIEAPLLLVLDDGQWFDTESLRALVAAVRRLPRRRIGLLIATTPDDSRLTEPPRLATGPLDADASGRLLRRCHPFLSAPLFDRVLREAAGNPAGITQIARALSAPDASPAALLAPRLPLGDRLQEAVAARLRGLDPAAHTFLLLAVHAGTDRMDALRDVARAAGIPADAPAAAEAAGLVTVQDGRLSFRHPLMPSAVHWTSSFTQRRRVHLALGASRTGDPYRRALHRAAVSARPDEATAAALEEGVTDDLPQAVAVLETAADLSPARKDRIRRLIKAADAASVRAETDALRALVRRIGALPTEPHEAASAAALEARLACLEDSVPGHALSLLTKSFSPLHSQWPPAFLPLPTVLYGALAEPAWSRRVEPLLSAVLHADPARRQSAGLVAALCWADRAVYAPAGRVLLDEATRRAAGALSREGGLPAPSGQTADSARDGALVATAVALDDPAAARAIGPPALRHALARGHHGTALAVATQLQIAYLHLGDRTAVLDLAEGSRQWAATPEKSYSRMMLDAGVAQVRAWEGDDDRHRRLTDGILSYALPRRLNLLAARARWARGLMALAHGRPEEAYEQLRLLWHDGGDCAHPFVARWALGDLVAAAVAAGQGDEVRPYVERAHRFDERSPCEPLRQLVARSQALLCETAEAGASFAEALTGGEELRFERARTRLAFGEWLRRQRHVSAAREQLQQARDLFGALGADIWYRRAASELLAAGDAAPSANVVWAQRFGLTPRETQVAELAAAGLTNQKIGWQLGLTPRTVASHLSQVFVKTGASSRKQLPPLLRR